MGRFLFTFLSVLTSFSLNAQTIIDLEKGGHIRAKTMDDYAIDLGVKERQRQDSIDYIDNLRRGFNALYMNKLDEAEKCFKEALKKRPDASGNYIVYYNLALVDIGRNQQEKAIERLTPIIKDNPNFYDARLARAEANLQLNRAQEAIEDAEAILNLPSEKGVTDNVLQRTRFVRAAARYQLHLYADSHTDIVRFLKNEPNNENARILEALTLQKMGQPKEALNKLNLIVASNPKSIDALSTRASVLAELDMTALACNDYDALIELAPEENDYYIERARMLIRLGEKSRARNDLDKAVSLGTPHGVVQALYNLTK